MKLLPASSPTGKLIFIVAGKLEKPFRTSNDVSLSFWLRSAQVMVSSSPLSVAINDTGANERMETSLAVVVAI